MRERFMMAVNRGTERFRPGLVLLPLLLLAAGPAFSQFILEANLGLNLLDISPTKVKAEIGGTGASKSPSLELAFPSTTMAAFGVTAGMLMKEVFVGGELAYYSGSVAPNEYTASGLSPTFADGTHTMTTADKENVTYLRVGPVVRYYFGESGLRPFIGGAIDYESTTWTSPASAGIPKETMGLIDIAGMGGVSYDIAPHITISALARLGYYITLSPAKIAAFGSDDVKVTESWMPLILSFGIGYKFS